MVAILSEAHEHHAASLALLAGSARARFAVSAHSYAEAYSTLTRGGERSPFGFTAGEAWAALASLRATTGLVALTAAQTFEATGLYAASGGTGPRLYDALIGGAAVVHGILGIVTWNVGHMRPVPEPRRSHARGARGGAGDARVIQDVSGGRRGLAGRKGMAESGKSVIEQS